MRKKIFYVFITLTLTVLSSACAAQSETAAENPREAVPAADLIRQADEAFKERQNPAKLREAIALLKRARIAEERNYEAAWKLARYNYVLGENATDAKESEKAFTDCISAGGVAQRIAPDQPDGYFWQAACYGGEAERSPVTKGLTGAQKIRELMGKVVELKPDFQGASAYAALATVELKTSMFGGDAQKAVEYASQALKISPDNFLARLTLAEAYLALDRKPEAKKELETLFKTKPSADLLPEYRSVEEKGRKLLEANFK